MSPSSRAKSWWLYVIRTGDNRLYAGIALDVDRRLGEHLSGGSKAARFLRGRQPLCLVFRQRIGARSLALRVEYHFKQLKKNQKETVVQRGMLTFDAKNGRICRR